MEYSRVWMNGVDVGYSVVFLRRGLILKLVLYDL